MNVDSTQAHKKIKKLDRRLALLKELAQEIDPFRPLEPSDKQKLKKAGINHFDDPFSLTNQLLKKLEDGLEERLTLEQQSSKGQLH